jgi:hypothetical protein
LLVIKLNLIIYYDHDDMHAIESSISGSLFFVISSSTDTYNALLLRQII